MLEGLQDRNAQTLCHILVKVDIGGSAVVGTNQIRGMYQLIIEYHHQGLPARLLQLRMQPRTSYHRNQVNQAQVRGVRTGKASAIQ